MSNNDNVVTLDVLTRLDLSPERIMGEAAEQPFDEVLVIGFTDEGEFWFSSSVAGGGDALWLLELAKKKLLEVEIGDR